MLLKTFLYCLFLKNNILFSVLSQVFFYNIKQASGITWITIFIKQFLDEKLPYFIVLQKSIINRRKFLMTFFLKTYNLSLIQY